MYSDVTSTISASCKVDLEDVILNERVSFSSNADANLLYCEPISVNFFVKTNFGIKI